MDKRNPTALLIFMVGYGLRLIMSDFRACDGFICEVWLIFHVFFFFA